ncbi:hypothetical protein ACLKA6_012776 [Drosophila palustris]
MEKEAAQTVPRPTSDQISSKLNFIPSRDQIVPKPLSIPNSNNAASLLDKADGQIMPKPNSIPSRDQIVPKSLFIPNPDDPVNLMEKAADVTGKDTFTATFTQCFKCQKFGHTQYDCKQPYALGIITTSLVPNRGASQANALIVEETTWPIMMAASI